ncbi:hypothetical protein BQ8482_360143 [Mesorhizobium delmotii]|uniref:Uncharacterized protein n=1 Tax=Mesorhizobium delmotii TaxID=1631247 RepID=A0A2P9ARG3_9HYPH|nr:hypothetical protein BQ8482_360143 [Mesorhizobium delmotii]
MTIKSGCCFSASFRLAGIAIDRPPEADRIRFLHDNGSSDFVRWWSHLISVERIAGGKTRYTDRVEIEAGPATLLISLFVRFFFWHRQHRLLRLARGGFSYSAG